LSIRRKVEIHQLVRDEMLGCHSFRCHVESDSMAPIFRTGDLILVAPGPVEALSAGDIVQVHHRDVVVTHRLMSSRCLPGCTRLITKGDRALIADQPWSAENVSGRVVAVDRGDRSLVLENSWWHALVGRVLIWEWRNLSGFGNSSVQRVVHWCCRLGVSVLVKLAWFAVEIKAGKN
jgi:signal peptidase I